MKAAPIVVQLTAREMRIVAAAIRIAGCISENLHNLRKELLRTANEMECNVITCNTSIST